MTTQLSSSGWVVGLIVLVVGVLLPLARLGGRLFGRPAKRSS